MGTYSFDDQRTVDTPSGARLNLFVKKPAQAPHAPAPRAIVQINHGFAEHAGRYARFADYLAERGIATYAHDHRGHGYTRAAGAPMGRFAEEDGAAMVVEDIAAVHTLIAAENPGVPVFVFGHSMGGLVALNFVLRHSERIAGAAIWNANFSAGLLGRLAQAILAWERFRMGSDVPSRLLPRLTFQTWSRQFDRAGRSADWLSRDAAEVEKYVADPLCGWDASVSMWEDVFRFVFTGADDRNFAPVRRTLPFHLVGGESDPATDKGKAVKALARRLRRMGFKDVTTTIYAETRHEGLNEVNRDLIMADFVSWLDRVLAAAPLAQRKAGDSNAKHL